MRSGFLKEQKGAMLIIEAAIVFPIVVVVVLITIMAGEAAYQHHRVQSAVTTAIIEAAARCEDPTLDSLIKQGGLENGGLPTDPNKIVNRPYRYIFTGKTKEIGQQVQSELQHKISSMNALFFRRMKPTNPHVQVTTKVGILISTIEAQCTFDVPLPIRIPFSRENLKFVYTVYESRQIGDGAEFVRNVSFVQDMLERWPQHNKAMENIDKWLKKIAEFTN